MQDFIVAWVNGEGEDKFRNFESFKEAEVFMGQIYSPESYVYLSIVIKVRQLTYLWLSGTLAVISKSTKPKRRHKMKLYQKGSNMTELDLGFAQVFFSYETPVAAMLPSGRYVKTSTKYSVTTTKHVNNWLKGVLSDVEAVEQDFIDDLTNEVTA